MKEKFPDEKEKVFLEGDVVRVKRSSGEIEDGWVVFSFNPIQKEYSVKKEGTERGTLTKIVKMEDLVSWNK